MHHLKLLLALTSLGAVGCGYVGLETQLNLEEQQTRPLGGGAGADDKYEVTDASGGSHSDGGRDGSGGRNGSGGMFGTGGTWMGSGGNTNLGGAPGSGGNTHEGVIFYDRLDGPMLPGIENDTGGTLTFTESNSRDGSPVLKASQGLPDQVVITHEFLPVSKESLYFRGWLYVPEGAVTGSLKLVGLHDDGNGNIDVNLLPDRVVEVYVSPSGSEKRSAIQSHPLNEWFCLEIHYDLREPGSVKVLANGVVTTALEHEKPAYDGQVSVLDYGLPFSGSEQTGGYVYWDDVALSNEPMGCD